MMPMMPIPPDAWVIRAVLLRAERKWNLCVFNDYRGTMRECCTHGHATAQEARDCVEGQREAKRIMEESK
jgi:hypothetical protein